MCGDSLVALINPSHSVRLISALPPPETLRSKQLKIINPCILVNRDRIAIAEI